ncbi:response regulator receiver protein [Burkholderia ubonensis]|uniref:response regulator transcription factor n=1 Tax=Burkholderia ubonensis TaxID=101571 RepID=UPI0007520089|nr:response regulator [Burkholderia ubonensis]KWE50859.1 response regulator receiver protein [Burkholderia ubonensis]KWE74564.1 response regulator receiver protein [Burkholderia ubonensis]KWE81571.1 response regulator receiver protein [Burkholderia ubonensis]
MTEVVRVNIPAIVAIVDDDAAIRLATASLVRSLGWPARTFASAEEFLGSGDVGNTSCLISDIRMPGMSGVDMYLHLIGLGIAPATIFITAFPTVSLQAEIRASGALVLLEKPVDATVIAHWLDVAMCRP